VDMLQAVHDWLENQVNWFLILDNADDIRIFMANSPESDQNDQSQSRSLLRYIPQAPGGSILWTSRDGGIVSSLVGKDEGVMVGKMSLEESVKLLRGLRTGPETSKASIDEENLLGRDGLDGLPLAITQAQAFMEISGISISAYLRLFNESESELLDNEFSDTYRLGVPNSVIRTWRISMTRIATDSPCAERILKTIAFFDNQGIPFELIREAAASESSQSLENLSEISILQTTGRLAQYSFLQRQQKASEEDHPTYEQHRLLQLAMRNALNPSETKTFSKKAQGIMEKLFPIVEVETWNLCKRYLPHALKVATLREANILDPQFPELLLRIGVYHYQQGLFQRAEQFHLRALHLRKSTLGESHLDTIQAMHELASIWQAQGHYIKAEPLRAQVLELRKTVLREKHPDTIRAMNNLASTWQAQGYLGKAELLQMQVLELRKTVLGEKHPDTIRAMSNLAWTWQAQGNLGKAEQLQTQVLELRKTVLGEKHPDTIVAMNNLASTWQAQGHLDKAELLRAQVLGLWKTVLGEKHPDTIRAMNNLASTWQAQGHLDKAEQLRAQVLELWKTVLGEKHPDTIVAMNNLASTWQAQGHLDKAEQLQTQVLELRKTVLGEKHPDTIVAMSNLAWTWQAQGYLDKAEQLRVQVLELRKTVLGEKHPDTIVAMSNLAWTWQAQGHLDKAEQLRAQVLELRKTVLGEKHPDTIMAMNNLALAWHAQGHYIKAEKAQIEALELLTSMLGESHPNTRMAMANLAATYEKLGRNEEAVALLMKQALFKAKVEK
jgi:tetratricopeptide (TPR) repeat protein